MTSPWLVLVTGPPGTGKSTLAEHAADALDASVLGWDWVMAGLSTYGAVQEALRGMSQVEHRGVGWSVMLSLATAQLRCGRSVVLDGVARDAEVAAVRSLPGARALVVVTSCGDLAVHRSRVEGRVRNIPGWYELDWVEVERVLKAWQPPAGADLELDAANSLDANLGLLAALLPDS